MPKKSSKKKPEGWSEFDSLARKLAQVPKSEAVKEDEAKPTKKTPKK